MCGLVMLITKSKNGFTQTQQNIFNSLLYLSGGFRGSDGAGAFVVDNTGNVKMAKDAAIVHDFLRTPEYDKLETAAFQDGWAMVGHNRSATKGVITDENAHPFVIDDKLVLVHNGTFNGSHKHIKDTEVDSEAIGHALLEEPDVAEALKKINAAYALIWYDVENKAIKLIRNNARPLWYMETDSSYIYTSEECFLDFVIKKFSLVPLPKSGPFEIESYHLSTYTLTQGKEVEFESGKIDCEYAFSQENYRYPGWGDWKGEYTPTNHYRGVNLCKNMFQQVIEHSRDHLPKVTYSDWIEVKKGYEHVKNVSVIISDLIDEDNKGNRSIKSDYIMVGHTIDGTNTPVGFKLYSVTLEEAIMAVDKVYSVMVTSVEWKRVDELYPVDQKTPMETWPGVSFIHGYGPKELKVTQHEVH